MVRNDIQVAGIYHKLGYRGSPITQLSLGENDDCRGYLVGEPHKGLAYMFQMMNEARIDVGMSAAAIASAAYYASLQYTRERPQGSRLTAKDPTLPQVPIIEHADVKRMLLFQRAVVEGSLSLLLQCSLYADLARVLDRRREGTERTAPRPAHAGGQDLPLGDGHPLGQPGPAVPGRLRLLRRVPPGAVLPRRPHPPDPRGDHRDPGPGPAGPKGGHEGRQGRPALSAGGGEDHEQAREVSALAQARRLRRPWRSSRRLRPTWCRFPRRKAEYFLADATLYLEFFGIIAVAWQWLVQALAVQTALGKELSEDESNFYQGKFQTFLYFFHYELPKIEGLTQRLMEGDGLTVGMKTELFE